MNVLGAAPGTTVTALAFATGDEPGNVAWLSTGIDEIAEFEASQRRTGLRLGSAGVGLLGLVVANVILGHEAGPRPSPVPPPPAWDSPP